MDDAGPVDAADADADADRLVLASTAPKSARLGCHAGRVDGRWLWFGVVVTSPSECCACTAKAKV
jgi:hypothetical protein